MEPSPFPSDTVFIVQDQFLLSFIVYISIILQNACLFFPMGCQLDICFLLQITKELSRLQKFAKINKLSSDDISGGTITLSNIGGIGGKFGCPLVNSPEVAIIAMGRIQKIPHFAEDGNVCPASVMTVCSDLKTFTRHLSPNLNNQHHTG